jgi:hypothetical protein
MDPLGNILLFVAALRASRRGARAAWSCAS